MALDNFIKNILSNVRIDLTEEFDRNFERKAFFDRAWKPTSLVNKRGSVMARTNNLRRSVRSRQDKNGITWSSSLPYATLQNEGGEVVVTEKMKKFFWAMFYKSSGAISKTAKGEARNNARNKSLIVEATQWKALALQKTGSKMIITQRQFIGDHPVARQRIEDVVDRNFKELDNQIFKQLKQR